MRWKPKCDDVRVANQPPQSCSHKVLNYITEHYSAFWLIGHRCWGDYIDDRYNIGREWTKVFNRTRCIEQWKSMEFCNKAYLRQTIWNEESDLKFRPQREELWALGGWAAVDWLIFFKVVTLVLIWYLINELCQQIFRDPDLWKSSLLKN